MISMTAMLLTRTVPKLPRGRLYFHSSEKTRLEIPSDWQLEYDEQKSKVRSANIERVFQAVTNGDQTILAICLATKIGRSTVIKALGELEDWPGGGRIKRFTGAVNKKHMFIVKEPS